MVCGGESVKPAGACPVSNDTASCGDVEQEPRNEILEGPKGRVVVRDVDGDGIYNPAVDEIHAVAEGEVQEVEVGKKGADAGEVTQRLKAMGIGGLPRRGTPIGLLKDYVDAIREARAFARDGDAKDVVELALSDAKDAAAKAHIPVEKAVLGEIRGRAEYYGLISVKNLAPLPYFDKENRKDMEGSIDAAKKVAGPAGISDEQFERDSQGARYIVSQMRLVEGMALARARKKGEAMKAFDEGKAIADMGGFEESFVKLLKAEYAELISVDSLSSLPFYDGENRDDVEGRLDVAAIVGNAAGLTQENIDKDAQGARFELCIRHYVEATKLAKEGKVLEARVAREKADSISEMGDYGSIFGITSENIEKAIADYERADRVVKNEGAAEEVGWKKILAEIETTLNHMPHTLVKAAVRAEGK